LIYIRVAMGSLASEDAGLEAGFHRLFAAAALTLNFVLLLAPPAVAFLVLSGLLR
jgi:hypothetical protein